MLFRFDAPAFPFTTASQDLQQAAFAHPPGARLLADLGGGPAGGDAIAHHAGGMPTAAGAPIASARRYATGRTAAEPSLGIAPDGTVYYNGDGQSALGLPTSILLRSRDQGASWQELDPVIRGVPGDTVTLDPFLYVDPVTGRIFDSDFVPPCSPVSYSQDGGEQFGVGVVCSHADHQNIFAGPPPAGGAPPSGTPHVAYYCAVDGGASVVALATACSKSLTGGATWARTGAPAYPAVGPQSGGSLGIPGYCYGATGHGRVDNRGVIYLPRGWCGQPYLSISRDEGASWTRVQVADIGMNTGVASMVGLEDHEARVAIDASGIVYYFWIARDRLPYLAVSRDGGTTFGAPLMVAAPGVNEAWGPSIDVGAPGRVAFSYMGTTNSPGPPYCTKTTLLSCTTATGGAPKPATAYASTTWNGYMGISIDALSADPTFQTATVNEPNAPLVRGTCGPVNCQQEADFLTLQIAPDGTPWASFVAACTADPAQACSSPGAGIAGRLVAGPNLRAGSAPASGPGSAPAGGPGSTSRNSRRCTARRRFVLRLRVPRGTRVRRLHVLVNGRRVHAHVHRGRITAVIDLRRRGGQRVIVRSLARTTRGKLLKTTRRYRVCP
ncbi:MAG: sialidase family protein [Solirubrobacteraceae bacterium]